MDSFIIKKIFLISPAKKAVFEAMILFSSGILFLFIDALKIPFFPFTNISGLILIIISLMFHLYCEKIHKQAHTESGKIDKIIKDSIYSRIRHPIYLSVIIMNIGTGLAFGNMVTMILAVIFSIFIIITALFEEDFLCKKFPEYIEYKKNVRWRMIPFIF